MQPGLCLTRRSALLLSTASCLLKPGPASASDTAKFWDKKDPSAWTTEEISQLTNNSPWAVSVTAEVKSNDSNMAGSVPAVGGRGGRRGVSTAGTAPQTLPKMQAVIRWASAEPIRQALHLKFPASLTGHYVVSVSGLPMISGQDAAEEADAFASLKEQTSLEVKRGEAVQPGVAFQDPEDTSTIYFGFLPALVPVMDAKTAIFETNTGPLAAKAKFNLTKMKYHGELAV